MANFSVSNIKISGISLCIPEQKVINSENEFFDKLDIDNFIKHVGVKEFRKSNEATTSLDLAFQSAKKLIADMKISNDEIEILILVTQTPDYFNIPNSSTILQHKLELKKSTICFDLPLGCAGFVYGLSVISTFMKSANLKKGLLICADTLSKVSNVQDKTVAMLFGDAASTILIESTVENSNIMFCLGTDGSGYESIIVPDGGYRNPINQESLKEKTIDLNITRKNNDIILNGMDVFSFGISQAPKSVKEMYEYASITNESVDYFVFHQANMMMNEMIRKKLKLENEKVPISLELYGNTSSVSIPLTMVTQLKTNLQNNKNKLLLCGFGVGLSWGSCFLETDKLFISDLIEI